MPATRPVPQPAFPGDDGAPEESVRAALARAEREPGPQAYLAAIAELCLTRLLVPIRATGRETDPAPGEPGDPGAEHSAMSLVLLRSDDQTAVLAFTGIDALHRWDPAGRPVLVTLDVAAAAAVADGADTLLVDLAGPYPLQVTGEVLAAIAAGHRLVALDDGGFGWAVPAR